MKTQTSMIPKAQSTICGGIDFENLPGRDPLALSGVRTAEFQMIATQKVIDAVHAHGKESPDFEVCGVLVGEVYRDAAGPYLHIEASIEGRSAHSGVGQVTFTDETWSHINKVKDRDFARLRIVGWYHTHPGHGIFLSEVDLFLHENFFDLPWQAALVHDPHSGEDGIFGWKDDSTQRINFLIEGNEPAKVISAPAAPAMKIVSPVLITEAEPIMKQEAASAAVEVARHVKIAEAEKLSEPEKIVAVKVAAPVEAAKAAEVAEAVKIPEAEKIATEVKAAPIVEIAKPAEAIAEVVVAAVVVAAAAPVAEVAPAVNVAAVAASAEQVAPAEQEIAPEQMVAHPAVASTLFATATPIAAVEEKKKKAKKIKKQSKGHGRKVGKFALALLGLALYAATGLLVGLLIQQMNWHLPSWPNNQWPG